jgi:hypothetical protein
MPESGTGRCRRWWSAAGLLLVCSAAQGELTCRVLDGGVELARDGQVVLHYHTSVVRPPAEIDPVYARSGFIHPVRTPGGRVVTADFPPDHAHQHGLFAAWVNTTFQDRKVDFWNQAGRTGRIEHVRLLKTESAADTAAFTAELRHVDLTSPGGEQPVLRELWTVRAYDGEGPFVFDIESRQTCIADTPLTINEYHYGGMAFRGSSQWFSPDKAAPADFQFLTSEGLDRISGNHTRPRWVVAHGSIDGQPCGLAVMGHPDNPRYPEPVRLHPTKPYFVFSPPVLGEMVMEPGQEQVRRYRYVAFDGPPDGTRLDQELQKFTAP